MNISIPMYIYIYLYLYIFIYFLLIFFFTLNLITQSNCNHHECACMQGPFSQVHIMNQTEASTM